MKIKTCEVEQLGVMNENYGTGLRFSNCWRGN